MTSDLSSYTIPQLRQKASGMCKEQGVPSTWVAGARRSVIEVFVNTGELPPTGAPTTDEVASLATEAIKAIEDVLGKRVRGMVKSAIKDAMPEIPQQIHVHMEGRDEVKLPEMVHECLPDVLKNVEAGVPTLMVGPAGSGKTTIAAHVAMALDLPYSFNSLSMGCSESEIIGWFLPTVEGVFEYVPAPFVHAWREGGVHLFDEVDAADSNVLLIINAPLGGPNAQLSVPKARKVFDRHPDFVCMFAANTYGRGADRQYVGRTPLDAATLDRFSVSTVDVGYDKRIERALVEQAMGDRKDTQNWIDWCWSVRESIGKSKLRRIMSTRTLENGAKLIARGVPMADVQKRFFAGWTKDEASKILGTSTGTVSS